MLTFLFHCDIFYLQKIYLFFIVIHTIHTSVINLCMYLYVEVSLHKACLFLCQTHAAKTKHTLRGPPPYDLRSYITDDRRPCVMLTDRRDYPTHVGHWAWTAIVSALLSLAAVFRHSVDFPGFPWELCPPCRTRIPALTARC